MEKNVPFADRRIIYGSLLAPTTFDELIPYSAERPYTVIIKKFAEPELTIPHFASTIEVLIGNDISGEVFIDDKHISIQGDCVIVIPPVCIHSLKIQKSPGVLYIVKLSMEEIGLFLNYQQFFKASGGEPWSYPYECRNTEAFIQIVSRLIEVDDDLFLRMAAILEFLRLLSENRKNDPAWRTTDEKVNLQLMALFNWSMDHCGESVTVEDAAAQTGYSKYHFCHWFRQHTGITYLEYLTQIRAKKAAALLFQKNAVNVVAAQCGYESVSHFIRIFRNTYKCTPGEFCKKKNLQ